VRLLWCGNAICEERDAVGSTTTKRFFAHGEQQANQNFFYARDHLGSTRELVDTTGATRSRYDYDPYGRTTKISGDIDASFTFTGHYVHAPSGLLLTLYRAYNADVGRWLSEDPIAGAGSNAYGYVRNRSIIGSDPYGLYDVNDLLRDFGNAAAGALDGLIPGLGGYIGRNYPGGDLIDFCSRAYRIAWWAGTALPLIITVAEAAAAKAAATAAGGAEAAAAAAAETGTTLADDLAAAAARARNTVGEGSGAAYGTRVHSAFEAEVNALGNEALSTEVSYLNGKVVPRGTPGSVRVDVVNGPVDAPISIYDLKTGSAKLTPARVQSIQSHVPGGANVPVSQVR